MASTTIGALKKELKEFLGTLEETRTELTDEIQRINQSATDIREEYNASAKNFARNTLPELSGPAFDEIAELAQRVEQLTGQGLAYYRQSLFDRRDAALETVNGVLPETVDVSTFPPALAAAGASHDEAKTKKSEANQAADNAAGQLQKWEDSSEHKLLRYDESLRASGKPGISPETKSYYDTESLIEAIVRYITRDKSYRDVRRTLVAYRQGFDGRDAFADINNFKATEANVNNAAAAARQAKEAVDREYAAVRGLFDTLSAQAPDILTDQQILASVQDRLAEYLATPEFMKAAADQYGEDFPSGLPLLAAKLKTLDDLAEDVQEKLTKLNQDIQVAAQSYDKIKRADQSRYVDVDLDELQEHNRTYREGYSTYTGAAEQSRQRTGDWSPSRGGDLSTVWNVLLLDHMLDRSRDPGSMSLPDLSPMNSSGRMDLDNNDFPRRSSSSLNLGVNLDQIFRDVANNTGRIDLSPPPPPPRPSYSSSSSSMSSGGRMSLGGGRSSMSSSGRMKL